MIGTMVGQTLHLYDIVTRDRERLMEDKRRLEKEAARPHARQGEQALIGIVGASPAIRHVFAQINVVARTHTTLLLRGESGTGKELFARAAHDLSPRKDGPFVRLNCAALSENMLESELFGHEKGSFTGALGKHKGRFELADKGTLFLDEIGEISSNFQAKLLRVLQEGEFERVGGSQTLKVDVRFVFATNKNLEAAVECGSFRSDLYYRINVVSILLPPLRERPEDVTLLAQEFLRRFNEENGMMKRLTPAALRQLQGCRFPGNVRELENCVRRAAALSREDAIGDGDFACNDASCLSSVMWRDFRPAPGAALATSPPVANPTATSVTRRPSYGGFGGVPEREKLIGAMERAGWVQAKAARLLNITPAPGRLRARQTSHSHQEILETRRACRISNAGRGEFNDFLRNRPPIALARALLLFERFRARRLSVRSRRSSRARARFEETIDVLQNHRFAMHGLQPLRIRMPQCGDQDEGRHVHHRSQEVHGMRRPFRPRQMRRSLPGSGHLRQGLTAFPRRR